MYNGTSGRIILTVNVQRGHEVDFQTLFNFAAGILLSALGWFGRQLWDAVKELRSDLHKIETDLPRNYIAKDEFREDMREVKTILNEIFRKIDDVRDRKADK
jgi:hypothetical protein